jgi:hypothetical protein
MNAAEIQQRRKGPRLKRAAMSRKNGTCCRGRQSGFRAGGRQARNRVFRQDSKNECQDIVEEPTTAQAKEETAHSWSAGDV